MYTQKCEYGENHVGKCACGGAHASDFHHCLCSWFGLVWDNIFQKDPALAWLGCPLFGDLSMLIFGIYIYIYQSCNYYCLSLDLPNPLLTTTTFLSFKLITRSTSFLFFSSLSASSLSLSPFDPQKNKNKNKTKTKKKKKKKTRVYN